MSTTPGNPYGPSQTVSTSATNRSNSRMVQIRRVDPVAAGKVLGVIYAILGLVIGALFLVLMLVGAVAQGDGQALVGGVIGGIVMVLFVPLFYGIMGFLFGALGALLYNFCAGLVGGIEFEME